MKRILALFLSPLLACAALAAEAEVKDLSINGAVAADGKAKLTIEGTFGSPQSDAQKLIFSTAVRHGIAIARDKITHNLAVTLDVLQGNPKEIVLTIGGEGEIKQFTGEALQLFLSNYLFQ